MKKDNAFSYKTWGYHAQNICSNVDRRITILFLKIFLDIKKALGHYSIRDHDKNRNYVPSIQKWCGCPLKQSLSEKTVNNKQSETRLIWKG